MDVKYKITVAETKLAIIDERIEIFKLLLQAINESQDDLDQIHESVNTIIGSTIDSLDKNQETANSDGTKIDLRSTYESIEATESDLLQIQQSIQDENLKKAVREVIEQEKDPRSESSPEDEESSMDQWQESEIESDGANERDNSDELNNSISQSDSNNSDSDSDGSRDNIPEKKLSANNTTDPDNSPDFDSKNIPISNKASKSVIFSLNKTKSTAKKRKQESRCKLTEISQTSSKDNEVLASELPKKKRRTYNIPQLKSLVTNLDGKLDSEQTKKRCLPKEPLRMQVICKAKNKKGETKFFHLIVSKGDTFVDSEKLHMKLKSDVQSITKDSKSSSEKCQCAMCLSGKPVIGLSNNKLSHLYRDENIVFHCFYCDKSTQNIKQMRKHIHKYHWSSGEIATDNHIEDGEEPQELLQLGS